MVNGSWLMAQGWLGAGPGPQSQGARSHPWAMSHEFEALTINNNRLINASFEYILYVLCINWFAIRIEFKAIRKNMIQAIRSNSTFHNKFTIKTNPKYQTLFEFKFQLESLYPGIHLANFWSSDRSFRRTESWGHNHWAYRTMYQWWYGHPLMKDRTACRLRSSHRLG